MNKLTIHKITLAGLMHDVGKFAERASMEVSQDYIDRNSSLYQPLYKGNYSHKHALYTAAFIEYFKKDLPIELNSPDWGEGDSFINLAASHHKPETAFQWIIAIADRISSGLDRDTFERYNQSQEIKDYKKTRMISVLEEVSITGYTERELQYRYPLKPFYPENIFPLLKSEAEPQDNTTAEREYSELFNSFISNLKKLYHKKHLHLWMEHFDSLYQHYTSFVPAVTVGDITPDVSLYDHSRTTAALAASLYLYHKENGDVEDINSVKDYSAKKFLFITGDFYGIQDFIFSKGGSTQQAAAKLLRGRSFYISLLSELAADLICKKIGLTPLSVVLSAAGKFTIIAPNTEHTIEAIEKAKKEINDWFHRYFYSEASIGIATAEGSPEDLTSQRFPEFWQRLSSSVNRAKYKRIDLKNYSGVISDYLSRFNNELSSPLCPFCGKRPSEMSFDKESICSICKDHINIGKNIVKDSPIVAIVSKDVKLKDEHTLVPVFNKYHVLFVSSDELDSFAKDGSLLRYWALSVDSVDEQNLRLTKKSINNYIPRYPEMSKIDEKYLDRLLSGEKSERKKNELFDAIKEGGAKSFYHIAKEALFEKDGKYYGIEALGVLKADIDNLGLIFASGLKDSSGKSRITLSRLATLSRLVNSFFSVYLPYLIKTTKEYSDIYTVFAGGDDLFLIGPWNRMTEFVLRFHKDFNKYFCNNPDFTISAGMVIIKPDYPVQAVASVSEHALESAKDDKNCFHIFGVNIKWENLSDLMKIRNEINDLMTSGLFTRVMVYKMNEIIDYIEKESYIKKAFEEGKSVSMKDIEALKWRALLRYHLARNVGKTIKEKEKREMIIRKLIEQFSVWFDTYKTQIRLPLWSLLYETRR